MHENEMTNQKSASSGLSGIISDTQAILETPRRRFMATTRVDKQPFDCSTCGEVCAYEVSELGDKPNSLIAYLRPMCACEREARDRELDADANIAKSQIVKRENTQKSTLSCGKVDPIVWQSRPYRVANAFKIVLKMGIMQFLLS